MPALSRIYRYTAVAVAVVASAALPAALRAQDATEMVPGVRIISSTARELVLEITPRTRLERTTGDAILPSIEGSVVINSDRGGEPMAMRITVPVALPAPSGSTLEILSASYDTPVSGRIAPVPLISESRDHISVPLYRIDEGAYAAWRESGPAAELRYMGIARDVHAGSVMIRPYEFDGRAGKVRLLKSMRVRLRYAGQAAGAGMVAGNGLSDVTRMAFINSSTAGAWAIAPASGRAGVLARPGAASAARAWMRVEVKDDGLYQLTPEDFSKAGIDLASVDPGKIAIYGGDGGILNENDLKIESAAMHQIPAIVEQSGGHATRVLFYGAGPWTWAYHGKDSILQHRLNPYVKRTSYIVAVDGEAGRQFSQGGTGGSPITTLTSGIARVFFEEDRFNALDLHGGGGSGRDWFGSQLQADAVRPTDTRSMTMELPGLDHSNSVYYRVRAAIGSPSGGMFQTREGDRVLGSFSLSGASDEDISRAAIGAYTGNGSDIPGTTSTVNLSLQRQQESVTGYLDWLEVHYTRQLRAGGDRLAFDAPPGLGIAQFVAQDFNGSDILGLDVTDPANPLQLQSSTGDGRFTFTDQLHPSRTSRRYYLAVRSSARRVDAVGTVPFADLRNRALNVDMLVVTPEEFRDAAQKYVDYRNGTGMRAAYVTTESIYTEFSNGNVDPSAIRNYIAWAFAHWTDRRPSYVLLLGDGTYDYRNIVGQQKEYVPPYETDDFDASSYHHVASSSYDDFYARVTAQGGIVDGTMDMAIGRIPVNSNDEADVVISKIARYESARNYGLWRTMFALVADDDEPVNNGGWGEFTDHSETLSSLLPNWVEQNKIYLAGYAAVQVSERRFPAATEDLTRAIQQGSVVTNFVGHGNPKVWAHENVLDRDLFIGPLINDSVPTFVSAVTCNFGDFDDPRQVSGAELFLLHQRGGAVGVMTATRAVNIGDNERLMWAYYRAMFTRDPVHRNVQTVGTALMMAKISRGGGSLTNDQKYMVFGDPAMRLNLPHDSVTVTSVNTVGSDSTITVGALSQVTITGEVVDQFGSPRGDFNGTAIVSLFDADHAAKLPSRTSSGDAFTYDVLYHGGRLFRGPANVSGGHFSITFRVPKDIAYDTAHGRIHVYAYNDHDDAAGMTPHIRIFGSDTALVTDTQGPAIKLFMDDRSFRTGDVVTPQPLLIVDLKDTSGINASGSSIGHRIEAWIDGAATSVDLTDTYQTLPTDYGEGTAERRLLNLDPGEHSIRVRAWDIYNNVSETNSFFRISEGGTEVLKVEDVVNYPNPMSRETDFVFRHNQTEPLEVSVDIFTTSGRKVRELVSHGVTERFVRVHWDGRDTDGRAVGNGVYLYRLRVNVPGDETKQFETIEKVAVVR